MARHNVRACVRAGRVEPLERLPFAEGAEVMVTGEVPDVREIKGPLPGDWPVRRLGIKEPVTRSDIYDDLG